MKSAAKGSKAASATFTQYGREGTVAELYKRVIATLKLSNDEAWSAVASVFGPDAAGGPTYPSWYRCQLARTER